MTVHPTPLEVLRGARELLADEERWTQGEYARDEACRSVDALSADACCWCLAGALGKVAGRDPADHEPAIAFIGRLLRGSTSQHLGEIASFNDDATHSDVLALLDKAIALQEAA